MIDNGQYCFKALRSLLTSWILGLGVKSASASWKCSWKDSLWPFHMKSGDFFHRYHVLLGIFPLMLSSTVCKHILIIKWKYMNISFISLSEHMPCHLYVRSNTFHLYLCPIIITKRLTIFIHTFFSFLSFVLRSLNFLFIRLYCLGIYESSHRDTPSCRLGYR